MALSLALISCSSDDSGGTSASGGTSGAGGGSGSGGSSGLGGSSGSGGGGQCTATFKWLQKDAYKDTAGRSSELWPPHTTTTLDVTCEGIVVSSTFRENHGTKPGEKDKNGQVFLQEVGSMTVSGSQQDLEALVNDYGACECGTQFLSLDALQDTAIQKLVQEVSTYVTDHLTCSGSVDAAGLVQLLQQGDISGVIAELPNCTWDAGSDWAGGFDAALQKIIAAANETLSDYHVCNNDAELQADLVTRFQTTGKSSACDADSALCHGPKWFYTP